MCSSLRGICCGGRVSTQYSVLSSQFSVLIPSRWSFFIYPKILLVASVVDLVVDFRDPLHAKPLGYRRTESWQLETGNCSYGLASTMFNVHAPWAGVKVQKGFR